MISIIAQSLQAPESLTYTILSSYLTNSRSISKLRECVDLSYEIEKKLNNNCFIDLLEFDIRSLWKKLGEIIGETYEEELIDQMFSRFCLGK